MEGNYFLVTFAGESRTIDMGTKDKLRERFLKMPSGFTFNEMQPHPGNIMKEYAMKQVLDNLREAGLIK